MSAKRSLRNEKYVNEFFFPFYIKNRSTLEVRVVSAGVGFTFGSCVFRKCVFCVYFSLSWFVHKHNDQKISCYIMYWIPKKKNVQHESFFFFQKTQIVDAATFIRLSYVPKTSKTFNFIFVLFLNFFFLFFKTHKNLEEREQGKFFFFHFIGKVLLSDFSCFIYCVLIINFYLETFFLVVKPQKLHLFCYQFSSSFAHFAKKNQVFESILLLSEFAQKSKDM